MGLTYSRLTPVRDIHELFRELWPVETGHPLARCGPYLMPEGIRPIDRVFSPGVGDSSEFELVFAEQGIKCHLADGSVPGPPDPHPQFQFTRKFIGRRSDEQTVDFRSWVETFYPSGNSAILQMDIEGGEYESILGVDGHFLRKFKVMVLEVHCLNILTSQEGYLAGAAFFDRLRRDFHVCHLHVNNYIRPVRYRGLVYPSDIELTLVRKDLCAQTHSVAHLPHPLDRPSNPRKRDPRLHPRFEKGVIMEQ
jgi:hypothetical protein